MTTCKRLLPFLLVALVFLTDTGLASFKAGPRSADGELTLRLVFFDAVGLGSGVEAVMREEVEAIFRQARVRIHWLEPEDVASGYDGHFLRAILLSRPPTMFHLSEDTMGMVAPRRDLADAVFLFAPVIRRILHGRKSRITLTVEEWGRAYGKVLAHEVVHALAPRQPHARSGLMAGSLQPNVLAARRIRLDDASASALRRGLIMSSSLLIRPP